MCECLKLSYKNNHTENNSLTLILWCPTNWIHFLHIRRISGSFLNIHINGFR